MSASSKKKLRNAQAAEKMTERQMAEQKEAKKLKTYTIVFSVVLVVMLVVAIGTVAYRTVTTSGILERSTVAATVGGHDLTSEELNYYYIDYINNAFSDQSSYLAYFVDTTKPLDEQTCAFTQDGTWADYFLNEALKSAASTYALVDAAKAAGHELTDAEKAQIETSIINATAYAKVYYGASDFKTYLKGMYGNGASEKGYRAYMENSMLASSYYNAYTGEISVTADEIRAEDAENPLDYNSYSYNYYYVSAEDFLVGGTTAEDGTVTYSDEEKAAALVAAEAAAEKLIGEEVTSLEDLEKAITVIDEDGKTLECNNYAYSSLLAVAQEWIADESRVAGDKNYFPYSTHTHAEGETHSEDEDTSAYDVVKGYYVVYFNSSTDNNTEMVNIRHALITEGGTRNTSTGMFEYTDDMAAAKAKAEELYAQWKTGDMTEESFAELANTQSSDSDGTDGGLYENVYTGQMVEAFDDWCFDAARKPGDTGIVQTEFGYHIMYFVGTSENTYRDYMIESKLINSEIEVWYTALIENVTSELKDTKYILTDLVLR